MAQVVEADGVLEEVLFEYVMYQDVGGHWRAVESYKGTLEQIDRQYTLAHEVQGYGAGTRS